MKGNSIFHFSLEEQSWTTRASMKPFSYLGHNKLHSALSMKVYLGWL